MAFLQHFKLVNSWIRFFDVTNRLHIYMKIVFLSDFGPQFRILGYVWSRMLLWTEFRSIEQNFWRIPIPSASLAKLKSTRHWLKICTTFFGVRQIFCPEFCNRSRRQQNAWKNKKIYKIILHFCNSSYF